jgi:hypothetical protein
MASMKRLRIEVIEDHAAPLRSSTGSSRQPPACVIGVANTKGLVPAEAELEHLHQQVCIQARCESITPLGARSCRR